MVVIMGLQASSALRGPVREAEAADLFQQLAAMVGAEDAVDQSQPVCVLKSAGALHDYSGTVMLLLLRRWTMCTLMSESIR